jgi:hypothetical protein
VLLEVLISTGAWVIVVASLSLIVKLILGLVIVIRAREQDLPKIVRGMAGWFFRQRR